MEKRAEYVKNNLKNWRFSVAYLGAIVLSIATWVLMSNYVLPQTGSWSIGQEMYLFAMIAYVAVALVLMWFWVSFWIKRHFKHHDALLERYNRLESEGRI